jgi:transposase
MKAEVSGLGEDVKMDVLLDGSSGRVSRLEVIEGASGRRQRTREERARIAAESLLPGVRVSDIARKYDATRWQIYTWRKRLRKGELVLPESAASLPFFAQLVAEEGGSHIAQPQGPPIEEAGESGMTEIVLGDAMIRVGGHVDEAQLTRIIRAVRAAAP